jgi:hypothetical protein
MLQWVSRELREVFGGLPWRLLVLACLGIYTIGFLTNEKADGPVFASSLVGTLVVAVAFFLPSAISLARYLLAGLVSLLVLAVGATDVRDPDWAPYAVGLLFAAVFRWWLESREDRRQERANTAWRAQMTKDMAALITRIDHSPGRRPVPRIAGMRRRHSRL